MRLTANDLNLKYIRERYKVPAYKGVEIKNEEGETGIISGADGSYIQACFEKRPMLRTYHPKDVEYIGVKAVEQDPEAV